MFSCVHILVYIGRWAKKKLHWLNPCVRHIIVILLFLSLGYIYRAYDRYTIIICWIYIYKYTVRRSSEMNLISVSVAFDFYMPLHTVWTPDKLPDSYTRFYIRHYYWKKTILRHICISGFVKHIFFFFKRVNRLMSLQYHVIYLTVY